MYIISAAKTTLGPICEMKEGRIVNENDDVSGDLNAELSGDNQWSQHK